MNNRKAKKKVLPVFTLTNICDPDNNGTIKRTISNTNIEYYYKPMTDHYNQYINLNNVELVLCGDGSLWADACLYLLAKTVDNYDNKHVFFSSNIANDLAKYRVFIEEYDFDYLYFPKQKLKRPTYRYRAHLRNLIRSGELAKSTAQRLMQSVITFYRWLRKERNFNPANPMWNESDLYISFKDRVGRTKSKNIKTTDIAIKGKPNSILHNETIIDGGRLRPLSLKEQKVLVNNLIELGNIEMTLIILFALFSGARIQTVLTLKIKHFNIDQPEQLKEIRLACGHGTLIDTKHGKQLIITYPRWLYELINYYIYSNRYKERQIKWKNKNNVLNKNINAYIFLSNRGQPFYEDSIDRNKFNPNQKNISRPTGGTVRTFIAERLIPKMKKSLGSYFSFSFHDLRATFGMNLTDALINNVDLGKLTLTQARNEVRDRMGHDSYETTDNYLQYREKSNTIKQTQSAYERHLNKLATAIMDGLNE